MKKKDSGKSLILNIFIFFIILIMIGFIIFYQQVREYQKEIHEKERTIEIYKKEDKKDDKIYENYAKKLSQAKEEIKKVKKETNYKGFNELSTKEQNKQLDKYNEGSSKYDDLVLISKDIKENSKIDKPRIVQGDDGIGKVEVPKGMLDKIDKEKVIEGIQGDSKDLNSSEQDIVESVNNTSTTPTEPNQSNPVGNQVQNEPIAPSQGNNQVETPPVTSVEQPQVPQVQPEVQPEVQQPITPEVPQIQPEVQPTIPNTPIEPQDPIEEPTIPQDNTDNQTVQESFVPVAPQQPIEEGNDAPYRKPDVTLESSNKVQEQPMVPLEPAIPNEVIPMVPLEPAIKEQPQEEQTEEPQEEQTEEDNTEQDNTEQSQEEPIEEEE